MEYQMSINILQTKNNWNEVLRNIESIAEKADSNYQRLNKLEQSKIKKIVLQREGEKIILELQKAEFELLESLKNNLMEQDSVSATFESSGIAFNFLILATLGNWDSVNGELLRLIEKKQFEEAYEVISVILRNFNFHELSSEVIRQIAIIAPKQIKQLQEQESEIRTELELLLLTKQRISSMRFVPIFNDFEKLKMEIQEFYLMQYADEDHLQKAKNKQFIQNIKSDFPETIEDKKDDAIIRFKK